MVAIATKAPIVSTGDATCAGGVLSRGAPSCAKREATRCGLLISFPQAALRAWRSASAAPIVASMTPELASLLADQDQVIDVAAALRFMSRGALRWQVTSGRWRSPCTGAIVAHSGPMTERQRQRVALLWAGPGSALGGLTAAALDGFKSFKSFRKRDEHADAIHLVVPVGRWVRGQRPELPVVVHYSRLLGPDAVHPAREPRRTRIARSLIDAASWMATDRGAQAVLASGVQQRLVRVADLSAIVDANQRLRRRALIRETLGDIAGGAQALSELDFTRLVVRAYRLPEPQRQVRRKDETGRNRYLDVVWDREKLVVEIDGAQHMDAMQCWDDMRRDNDLVIDGYQVLRFPAWLVRYHPEYVAVRIHAALSTGGGDADRLSTGNCGRPAPAGGRPIDMGLVGANMWCARGTLARPPDWPSITRDGG